VDAQVPGSLSASQLRQFRDAILSAYPDRSGVEELLLFRLARNLTQLVDKVGMNEVVFEVLKAAMAQGWLDELVHAVIEDRPANAAVKRFALDCGLASAVAAGMSVPTSTRLLNSSYFDLTLLKRRIREHTLDGPPRLLGFSLADNEPALFKRLCSWLPHCLGDVEEKDTVSLMSELDEPDRRVKQVLRYLPDLHDVGVVCPVLTGHVPIEVVEAFWRGVSEGCPQLNQWFVFIFVFPYAPDEGSLAGVVHLPKPEFRRVDIAEWAAEVLAHFRWSAALAGPWTRHVERHATVAGRLDIRLTYDVLDRTIRQVRKDPEQFRRWLEQEA
jgi:hypothetical protein